jgi:hypothetical protein
MPFQSVNSPPISVFDDIQTQIAAKINTFMQIIFLTGISPPSPHEFRAATELITVSIQIS